jgi:prepilin-type processing-associated H-X9-DG protein/prepilin-type N-terminal cleavage/methylation domain-containing protein
MKRAFTLIEALIVVAIVALIAAFLMPMFARPNPEYHRRTQCQSNLRSIGMAFAQYVQDYDEKFPPAHVTLLTGWADVMQPYIQSNQLFQCPSGQSVTSTLSSDYFYNRRLSRLLLNKMKQPALTIMLGDGEDNAPTWNSWTRMTTAAMANPNPPSQRHLGFANYAFADGHVKMMRASAISSTHASPTLKPTFAVR